MKFVTIDGYTITAFGGDAAYADQFIAVPKELYFAKCSPHNAGEEAQLLAGSHMLSGYFGFEPFLCKT